MKKVLFIEDGDTGTVCRYLNGVYGENLTFITTITSHEGIECLKQDTFDLIICDGDLYQMTHGRDVVKFLQTERPQEIEKLVILSGDDGFIQECLDMGLKACSKGELEWMDMITKVLN